jgi:hypothetical protein
MCDGAEGIDQLGPRLVVAGGAERIALRVERGEHGGPVGGGRRREQGGAVLPDAGGIAPGAGVGRALGEFVLVLDEAGDGAVDAFLFLAEGGELEGLHEFALFRGGEAGAFEEALEDEVVLGIFEGRGDGEFGADAGFEAEGAEDLEEERIEGADAEAGEGVDEGAEGGLRGGVVGEAGEVALGEFAVQVAGGFVGSGGAGEAGEDAGEDFAGGLAGEGEGDDGGGIGAGGEEGEDAAAEGEGLAGAGGGGEGGVADGAGRGHAGGSWMRPAPPAKRRAKSSWSGRSCAGGQNWPARMAAMTARAAARAEG